MSSSKFAPVEFHPNNLVADGACNSDDLRRAAQAITVIQVTLTQPRKEIL